MNTLSYPLEDSMVLCGKCGFPRCVCLCVPYMGAENDRPVHSGKAVSTTGTEPAIDFFDGHDPTDPRRI